MKLIRVNKPYECPYRAESKSPYHDAGTMLCHLKEMDDGCWMKCGLSYDDTPFPDECPLDDAK